MSNEKPTWFNTFNTVTSNKIWVSIHDALLATVSIGYKYFIWDDGKIYTYSISNHNVPMVEPTNFKIEDVQLQLQ